MQAAEAPHPCQSVHRLLRACPKGGERSTGSWSAFHVRKAGKNRGVLGARDAFAEIGAIWNMLWGTQTMPPIFLRKGLDPMDMEFLGRVFSNDQIDGRLPKAGQVYEILRDAIISMKLLPGAPIVEKEICEALHISRTPLREAIIQLAAESLVVVRPGEGTFVNLIVVNEVLEGQVTRDTLEKRLVRLTARRFKPDYAGQFEISLFQQKLAADKRDMDEFFQLDNRFHQLICESSGFPSAWRTIHGATGQLDRIRRYALPKSDHFYESLEEHKAIFQHIRDGNEEAAVASFQTHIDRLFHEVDLISQLDPDMVSRATHVTIADIR